MGRMRLNVMMMSGRRQVIRKGMGAAGEQSICRRDAQGREKDVNHSYHARKSTLRWATR